jgi:hypothetical protein
MLNLGGFTNISESDKKFEPIENTITKGFVNNDLEKGKKVPVGTVSNGYKKIAEGKWRKVGKGEGKNKEEQSYSIGENNEEKYKHKTESGDTWDIRNTHTSDKHKEAFEKLTPIDHKKLAEKHSEFEKHSKDSEIKNFHAGMKDVHNEKAKDSKKEEKKNPLRDRIMAMPSNTKEEIDAQLIELNNYENKYKLTESAQKNLREIQKELNTKKNNLKTNQKEGKDENPKEKKPITLDYFKKLAQKSKSFEDFVQKVRNAGAVSEEVSDEFTKKYGIGMGGARKLFDDANKDNKDKFSTEKKEPKNTETPAHIIDGISSLTVIRKDAVKDFISKNNLDGTKLFHYMNENKKTAIMDFVTAVVGNPGNKYQKEIIEKFKNDADPF